VVNRFSILSDFGIGARTAHSIIGTVLALLMNRDMMINVLYIALV